MLLDVANIKSIEAWPTMSVSGVEESLHLDNHILYCSLNGQTEIQSAWKNNIFLAKKHNLEV